MFVKHFGCTTIHNKALYKCIIDSTLLFYICDMVLSMPIQHFGKHLLFLKKKCFIDINFDFEKNKLSFICIHKVKS